MEVTGASQGHAARGSHRREMLFCVRDKFITFGFFRNKTASASEVSARQKVTRAFVFTQRSLARTYRVSSAAAFRNLLTREHHSARSLLDSFTSLRVSKPVALVARSGSPHLSTFEAHSRAHLSAYACVYS
jgi:hypothetical protein